MKRRRERNPWVEPLHHSAQEMWSMEVVFVCAITILVFGWIKYLLFLLILFSICCFTKSVLPISFPIISQSSTWSLQAYSKIFVHHGSTIFFFSCSLLFSDFLQPTFSSTCSRDLNFTLSSQFFHCNKPPVGLYYYNYDPQLSRGRNPCDKFWVVWHEFWYCTNGWHLLLLCENLCTQ